MWLAGENSAGEVGFFPSSAVSLAVNHQQQEVVGHQSRNDANVTIPAASSSSEKGDHAEDEAAAFQNRNRKIYTDGDDAALRILGRGSSAKPHLAALPLPFAYLQ